MEERYYVNLAAAFVQGKLGRMPQLSAEEIIQAGLREGLRLHKFKRNAQLPRIRKALGILRGLAPQNLLDIGSGRGTFLWPLLDTFPYLSATTIDLSERRAEDLDAVRRGGVDHLTVVRGYATMRPFASNR